MDDDVHLLALSLPQFSRESLASLFDRELTVFFPVLDQFVKLLFYLVSFRAGFICNVSVLFHIEFYFS